MDPCLVFFMPEEKDVLFQQHSTGKQSGVSGLMRPSIKTKNLFRLFCSTEQFLLAARLMIHLFTPAESVLADSCSCPKAHFLWWDYNDSPHKKYSLGKSSFMLHGETWSIWGPSPGLTTVHLCTSFRKGQLIIKVKFEWFAITLPKVTSSRWHLCTSSAMKFEDVFLYNSVV